MLFSVAKLEVAKERKVGRKEKSKKGRVWIPFEKMRVIELNFMFEYTLVGVLHRDALLLQKWLDKVLTASD